MGRRYGLPRSQRLTTPAEFTATIKQGVRSRDGYFSVFARRVGENPQLGVAVSRRTSTKAVVRNRLKRQVRESFRHHKRELAGIALVVIAEPRSTAADARTLQTSLRYHWDRIAKQFKPS